VCGVGGRGPGWVCIVQVCSVPANLGSGVRFSPGQPSRRVYRLKIKLPTIVFFRRSSSVSTVDL